MVALPKDDQFLQEFRYFILSRRSDSDLKIKEIRNYILICWMTHYQQKEENYAKWESTIWLSV